MTCVSNGNLYFFSENCSDLVIKPNSVEHAYLAIIDEDLDNAYKVFSNIKSPRAFWGKVLVSIIKGYVKNYPTYFQIRNFLEIDLDFLLKNNKISYVEQVLGALEFLATINQEAYKFAGRVMLVNKLPQAALKYMEKSKQIYYNDPELHFMYANYYYGIKNFEKADFYINECLKLIPEYYPAKVLKEKIEQIFI